MKEGDIVYYVHTPGNETDRRYRSVLDMIVYSEEKTPLVIKDISTRQKYAECQQKDGERPSFSYHTDDLILASDDENFLNSLYKEDN